MRVALAVTLVLVTALSAVAQERLPVTFEPEVFYAGDLVEARILIEQELGDGLRVPERLPSREWIEVREIVVLQRPDGLEVRIVFQPFFVGTRVLPSINLGSVELEGVSAFVTRSSVDEATAPELRPQYRLPGTRGLFTLTALVLLGVPAVLVAAATWGRTAIRHLVKRYRANRPYRDLTRAMRALRAELHSIDGRSYYIKLLDSARTFLDRRFGGGLAAATTAELGDCLSQTALDPQAQARVVALFAFGDLVKFAHLEVTIDDRRYHSDELRQIVDATRNRRRRCAGT